MTLKEFTNKIVNLNKNEIELLLKEFIRECEHCSNIYTPTHKKQRFCSTNCRIINWEIKNNKHLNFQQK